jgi:DNA-binding response OmpR family regulator
VDLERLTLPLGVLSCLSEKAARRFGILPLRVDAETLIVAMTDPDDARNVDELSFISGKQVIAYAADAHILPGIIEGVYRARKAGQLVWHGSRVRATPLPIERSANGTPPAVTREPFGHDAVYSGAVPPIRAQRARPVVLVVDDEPVLRRLMHDALAQRGYDVVTASTGGEAYRTVKQRDPDAILLDAMLPDVHGFEICKRLKGSRRYQHIPIIMVTAMYKGWRMAADLKEAYGVHATVEKPFDIHHLVRVLEEALAGRSGSERSSPDNLSAEAQRLYKDSATAYRAGDLDGAATALVAAVAIDPLSATLRHQLGLLHAQRGQDFAAMQELEAAVDLDPTRFQTLRNLAVLYQKHGFRRKSCEIWERALSYAPDEPTRTEIRTVLLKLL